jgi:hypothetical protein
MPIVRNIGALLLVAIAIVVAVVVVER